ncbi:MAG: Helicase associated domain protein [Huintestinicola sp.]
MVQLYEHNKTTYENLISLYANHDRVACVQPTGTGKSFIMLKLIEDNLDKKFFIASPSLYIFEQLKTHAEDNSVDISNCVFSTYQKLIYMSHEYIESIEADYIILDEFHRLGSAEWGGTGVETLLNSHPNCKVLGTSATPIRYLDNMRNMAEEIFDSCYAVNMNLAEAIRRKILPLPVYVTAWYSFSGEIARLEEKIATVDNPYLRNKLYNKIQKAKSKVIDTDCGLESILHKHITNPNGKYIVFCPNIASLESAKNNCRHWFEKVNKKINVYSVYTTGDNVKQQFEAFKNDTSDCLKLLLCIDMLNEGIHVKDVDGVIMLRSTTSANVFYQQLGRALTCSNRNPVIFDLVNNYETGNTADEYASVMELGRHYKHDDSELDITFEIYDYVRDIRELLDDISNTFEMSWESTFQVLCEFINQNKRFPYQKEKYNGLSLGCWCDSQKMMYRNGRLSEVRINALEEIGFPWDTLEEAWNIKFSMLKAFKERTGRFPVRKDSLEDESIHQLYTWCSSQRQFYKTGRMLHDRILKFQEIGFELSVLSDAERWDEKYTQLVEICEMLNHFPSGNKVENKELMYSISQKDTQFNIE